MAHWGQILPYVLRLAASDRLWCLQSSRSHFWSGSEHYRLTDLWRCSLPVLILPLFMRCGAPTAHGSLMGNDEIRSRRRERRLTKVSLVRETPPCCNDNEQCPRDKADINADKRVHVDWSDR